MVATAADHSTSVNFTHPITITTYSYFRMSSHGREEEFPSFLDESLQDNMPPQSRGGGGSTAQASLTVQSLSSPDLPTLRAFSVSTEDGKSKNPSIASPGPSPLVDSGHALSSGTESDDNTPNGNSLAAGHSLSTSQLQQRRLAAHRSKSLHPNLHPSSSQLFPPFYNRQPPPLPPSPSLTSLLRPPFSTHTSHHTTPESSDVESSQGGVNSAPATTGTAAAVQKSAQTATTVPRASPNVPTYEYYGFALYLVSSAIFLMYLLWAYLPSPFLHQLGIHYYPDRWWALAVPAWLVMSILYMYIALASYNTGYLTLPMDSIENLVDKTSQVAVVDREGRIIPPRAYSRFQIIKPGTAGKHSRQHSGKLLQPGQLRAGSNVNWRAIWDESTDAVLDIPIGGVCEILYGEGRETGE
jgi:phosphatidylinositol N-acetylglucosaminyltransferase subunit P